MREMIDFKHLNKILRDHEAERISAPTAASAFQQCLDRLEGIRHDLGEQQIPSAYLKDRLREYDEATRRAMLGLEGNKFRNVQRQMIRAGKALLDLERIAEVYRQLRMAEEAQEEMKSKVTCRELQQLTTIQNLKRLCRLADDQLRHGGHREAGAIVRICLNEIERLKARSLDEGKFFHRLEVKQGQEPSEDAMPISAALRGLAESGWSTLAESLLEDLELTAPTVRGVAQSQTAKLKDLADRSQELNQLMVDWLDRHNQTEKEAKQ